MRRAVEEALVAAGVPEPALLADDLARAVLAAEDGKVRYAVLVREGTGWAAFGPYATRSAAVKAVDTGLLASLPDARGMILPLTPAPKKADWPTLLEG
jgi:hypothetical protein